MSGQSDTSLRVRHRILLMGGILTILVVCAADAVSRPEDKNPPEKKAEAPLRVGTSGTLTADKAKSKEKEKTALDSLQDFIKTETGMANDIVRQKDWSALGQAMVDGKVQVGVFQGYEFAWAQEKYPSIKPLALAVNVDRYPTVFVVVKKDNPIKDFAALDGKILCMPSNAPRFVRFYLNRLTQTAGKKTDTFFSKINTQDDPMDAIDDVVDGVVQATAIDGATLAVYKKQKPGRFSLLKPIAHSQPLPPVVIAYADKALNKVILGRFRDGLITANQKDRGQTMLSTFGLTGFEAVPADFEEKLAATRKAYPAEEPAAK